MLNLVLILIIFILGIYFGSFFTLASYRIPKHENITHKHSYCPNCKHKLGWLDLIPVFSYIGLKGKCRYCKNPISIRYFLFEILTGITFVLFAISLNVNIYAIDINTIVYFVLAILYFTSLFLIAGIEKETSKISKPVLIYGAIVSLFYIIYSYTLVSKNVYEYVIYLAFMVIILLIDIKLLKKNFKYNYWIQILILILNMLIFTGSYITVCTIIYTILAIGIKNIIQYIKKNKTKINNKTKKTPYAFFLCIANIVTIIIANFFINYLICK